VTPNVAATVRWLKERYTFFDVQTTNCRKIAGSATWSQHAWANGADLFASKIVLNQVAEDLRRVEGVAHVLWQVAGHFDHVHFDTWPQGSSTPPCAGGTLRVRYEDGKIGTAFPLDIQLPEDTMAILTDAEQKELQTFLAHIKAKGSNVGFVKQCIEDIREKNAVGGKYAPMNHPHPGGGGLTEADVKAIINDAQIVAK